MNQVAAEHLHDLRAEVTVEVGGLRGVKVGIDEPRGSVALGVGNQLHQQHSLVEHHGRRHPNARGVEPVEATRLGGLPLVLVLSAAEAAALLHRALGAAIAHGAALFVDRVVLEAALVAVFVDLGDDDLASVQHPKHVGLLAALQSAENVVEDAFRDERVEGAMHGDRGGEHTLIRPPSRGDFLPCNDQPETRVAYCP